MKSIFRILTIVLICFFNTSFGQSIQKKHILVIALQIKNRILFNNCVLERKMFDTNTCIVVKFDTISSIANNLKVAHKIYIDLDTLKTKLVFSNIEFESCYIYQSGDTWVDHSDGCLKPNEISIIRKLPRKKRICFDKIILNFNKGSLKVICPSIIFTLKD